MRFQSCAALLFPVAMAIAAPALAAPAPAASPRDTLIRAAFGAQSKQQALALIADALAQTEAVLAKSPGDREALLQHALATGYRGQLKRSPADAKATRDALIALAQHYPRDPEVQVALAGWHLTAVSDLGSFLARTLLGADKAKGLAALDRALALGGNRAFFPAYAALARLQLDSGDRQAALALADRAVGGTAPTPVDRIMQRAAQRLAAALKAGASPAAAAALAKQLLPFGLTN